MSLVRTKSTGSEYVPLAERLRWMQLFRATVTAVVVLWAALAPAALSAAPGRVVLGSALYLLFSLACEGIWRLSRRRGLVLFGAMLIVDGAYLAWLSYTTGGVTSPLRYFVLLHLIEVTLLASYRTGLKMALWHSVLLFAVFQAQQDGLLAPAGEWAAGMPGTEYHQLLGFVSICWLVAVGTATFSAVNERELRRRRFDLEALARMATDIESASTTQDVADVLLDSLVDAFGFERVLVLGSRNGDLRLLASPASRQLGVTGAVPDSDDAIHSVLASRETLLVSRLDPATDVWLNEQLPGARNLALVPLSAEGGPIGVVVVDNAARAGSRIERRVVSMLERFASHAALALRNAGLLEEVQKLAETDGLTALANRRTLESELERELSRARRLGEQVSMVMIDIDHFKRLNDTLGHQSGDEVLRLAAGALARECRPFDIAARYGGEEFAVVLPGCGIAESIVLAERLRQAISRAGTTVPVTASAGVATFPAHAGDAAGLVGAADGALYQSKREGRNRLSGAQPAASPAGHGGDDGAVTTSYR